MKRLPKYFIIGLILAMSFPMISQNCDIEIPANQFFIEGSSYPPGSTICLLPGDKDYLSFKNIQGTASQPITIINKGGEIEINTDHFYGIKFDNCKHIIFRGDGVTGLEYGIRVTRVGNGAGMSLDNMTTNVEVMNIEIAYTAIGGIYAKTEPYQGDCNNLITRDKFTMYDVKIHDCYIHDVADEGFYVGSSKYTGQTIYQCNNIVVLPHVIEGVQIYNNLVENTGWDGIQVSSATEDCNIYGNTIHDDSYDEEYFQMSGILIGGGSKCDCYNNMIFDGKGDGIDVFGMGFMKIYNNLIVNAGKTFQPGNPDETRSGIYIGYVEGAFSPNGTFEIYQNTIISPKSFGITYNNNAAAMGYIKNNLITDPGFPGGTNNYINLMVGESKISQSNNFLSENNSIPKFVDANTDNYDLQPNSPAVNYGTSLAAQGITFDILNRARPFHTYFDAGAFECHDPSANIDENGEKSWLPFPNPASDKLFIPVLENMQYPFNIKIISLSGQVLNEYSFDKKSNSLDVIEIDVNSMLPGSYIISLHSGVDMFTTTFTLQ